MLAPRTLSADDLRAISTVAHATLMGVYAAKQIDPSGKTILREIPGVWQDVAWQDYVQAAWTRLVNLVGAPRSLDVRLYELPAISAYSYAVEMLGALDATGMVTASTGPDPILARWAAGAAGSPVRGLRKATVVATTAGALLTAFFFARAMMAR